MDNAVQGFYMAAGMIIALMVLSVMIYMFRSGATMGEHYEINQETAQVTKFNGQFDAYAKVTQQLGAEHGFSFVTKGNTASDVISCANLAVTVNERAGFEEENKLDVVVICEGKTYSVYSLSKTPRDAFLVDIPYTTARSMSTFNEDDGSTLKFYSFLKEYNVARMVDIRSAEYNSNGETIYKYYFDVNLDESGHNPGHGITLSEVTGKVDKIVFTIYETQHFDNTTVWKETR